MSREDTDIEHMFILELLLGEEHAKERLAELNKKHDAVHLLLSISQDKETESTRRIIELLGHNDDLEDKVLELLDTIKNLEGGKL